MTQLYVLFEHAAGYALFKSAGYEEDEFLPEVQRSIFDVNQFKNIVTSVSFQPFRTGRDALENINSVSEGILHSHLQEFLENNVPKQKKKKHPVVLGVSESKLAAAISEKLEISCTASNIVGELTRGIRFHFHQLVEGFSDVNTGNKAQLGLGHHYSRARVKFNVNRIDNMIIQSISLVDQLDKDINTFTMRVREWYSHHFPELIKIVPENALYILCIKAIKDRKDMPEDVLEQLEEILKDPAQAQKIIELARSSMGMDISGIDLENVYIFAERIISLTKRRKDLMDYLRSKMNSVAPNLAALIGDVVGARLIAHAGSLINLAKYPASTVQILGAEKALFRALKTRGNTPKYGLIFHSKFIGKAAKSNKGRISRYLANKCSVASRIDCFRDVPTDVFGIKLRAQVEERLKFYETGELPKKNVDAMTEAMEEAEVADVEVLKQIKKAKKKAKKRKLEESGNDSTFLSSGLESSFVSNDSFAATTDGEDGDTSLVQKTKKKKKKKNRQEQEMNNSILEDSINESQLNENSEEPKKKKKKLSAIENFDTSVEANDIENGDISISSKKKKKRKNSEGNLSVE